MCVMALFGLELSVEEVAAYEIMKIFFHGPLSPFTKVMFHTRDSDKASKNIGSPCVNGLLDKPLQPTEDVTERNI